MSGHRRGHRSVEKSPGIQRISGAMHNAPASCDAHFPAQDVVSEGAADAVSNNLRDRPATVKRAHGSRDQPPGRVETPFRAHPPILHGDVEEQQQIEFLRQPEVAGISERDLRPVFFSCALDLDTLHFPLLSEI